MKAIKPEVDKHSALYVKKSESSWKQVVQLAGNYFMIILFTYAGLTKLLEINLFYFNLLNSPVLNVSKVWVAIASWAIPFVELSIAPLLIYPKTTLKGLYLSITLLSLYILYTLTLLFLAPYQPCSCGGITASLTWGQQLWFTVGCLGFAGLSLYLKKSRAKLDL